MTEDTGVGGGHRDIFEHLNRLQARGHDVSPLLARSKRLTGSRSRCRCTAFETYEELAAALAPLEAIKVATWWGTAPFVWRASVTRGIPVYFVQDIETSYYPTDEQLRNRVLSSYRQEFQYMTISASNRQGLAEMGLEAELIPPGIDLDLFRPLGRPSREDLLITLGRSNPLKNLPLTVESWELLKPRPELWLFGIEPALGPKYGARYFESPSDEGVNELLNEATVFIQTSRHEGFCLPPLEAMAAGTPVVCTDAHGNRDFCRDGENCLMPAADPRAVSEAVAQLFADPELRRKLIDEGRRTASEYSWERRIDQVEAFFDRVAAPRELAPGSA